MPGDLRQRGGGGHGPGAELGQAQIEALADDLGVALQLTNILRDVREDAENGRVYLPAEDLRRFGVEPGEDREMAQRASRVAALAAAQAEPLSELMRFEAERAQQWFERGLRSCRCSTGAAGPACRRWPASTTACSRGSRPIRRARSARAPRCSTPEKLLVALRSFAGRGS